MFADVEVDVVVEIGECLLGGVTHRHANTAQADGGGVKHLVPDHTLDAFVREGRQQPDQHVTAAADWDAHKRQPARAIQVGQVDGNVAAGDPLAELRGLTDV